MDVTYANEILEYLNAVAETIIEKDIEVLKEMKSELDEYVDVVTSKIPEPSKAAANDEFEKCRVCAHDWITVYCDKTFHPGDKKDILQEEAVEFFFSLDERVRGVQKKFFVRGMIEEFLTPGAPLSDDERKAKISNAKIRIMAREQGLKASYKKNPQNNKSSMESTNRLWYFGDDRNFLQSDAAGLSDEEAIEYLLR